LTGQGLVNFAPNSDAKDFFGNDWNSEGGVLSEAYLGYDSEHFESKVGRQYYHTATNLVPPLVASNTAVGYKEAFEGVSAKIKLPEINTVIGLADFWKFQGRSNHVMGSDSGAPVFKDRVIIGGFGPTAYEFDNIFNSFVTNSSIPGISFTLGYANVQNLKYDTTATGDIDFYYANAGYKTPVLFDNAKFGLDFMYKGSRTHGSLKENYDYDGNFYALMAGLYDAYGFDFRYAFSTVSKNNAALQGVGNACGAYTATPIYGPFLFMSFAGMDLHKFSIGYDFGKIGAEGLKISADYWNGKQKPGDNVRSGVFPGMAAGTKVDVEGWDVSIDYKVPAIKGLTLSAIYETMDRKQTFNDGYKNKVTDDELWLRVSYDFDILK
ncbi:MAG: metalloid reductase RarA, partial [Campylobacter sp.]|nr:metalloid reductase RarA [Campylobacter sp.]